jgi:hypothetical protein
VALARSGLMALTGWPDGPPVSPPLGLPAHLDGLVGEIDRRAGWPLRISWAAALSGRAALLGLSRHGPTSANGSCRLFPTTDGWVALNLPRPDDIEMLPALTGRPVSDPWSAVEAAAAVTPAHDFVSQARLLGLAAARLPEASGPPEDPCRVLDRWPSRASGRGDDWRVVDLSSLWAGPMVARILAEAGAMVTKIESSSRPDAARATPAFYRWVHSTRESTVSLDLRSEAGRRRAGELIDEADVVIEGSRPRALEQLGLGPDDRPARSGRVWLSVTGHGRDDLGRDWVAFGDDAAVAGGLVGWDSRGEPVFCGDAVADPITGLVGAVAVLRARDAGGGSLIDLSMRRVAAAAAAAWAGALAELPGSIEAGTTTGWQVRVGDRIEPVSSGPPRLDWIGGA